MTGLRLIGVSAGSDYGDAVQKLLDAHRYTRGFELIPPGTATNTTEESPEGAGELSVEALFEAEFDRRPAAAPGKPEEPLARPVNAPQDLFTATPADAVAMAFGLSGETAADRAASANDPAPQLSLAANRALWPATWGKYFTDPMRWAGDDTPLLAGDDLEFLRSWFTDYVRAEGPLPALRVGRQPVRVVAGFRIRPP